MVQLRRYATFQNFVTALVFLFPVGGVTVEHWLSGIFILLCLMATGWLIRQRRQAFDGLHIHEKRFLWILLAHFLIFLITAFINDPALNAKTAHKWGLNVESRFLLAIPLYLMIRNIPSATKALLWGCALGVAVTVGQTLYKTYYIGATYSYLEAGAYSHLFTSPVTMLMIFLTAVGAPFMTKKTAARILLWAIAMAGLYPVAISGGRSGYAVLFLMPPVIIVYALKGRQRIAFLVAALIAIGVLFSMSDHISSRCADVHKDITRYFSLENKADPAVQLGSSDARLEMLRSLKYFARDHALFGVGAGNYHKAVWKYIEMGLVNPSVSNGPTAGYRGHPHNAFANAFMLKGIFGLAITILLLFYPLYVFVSTSHLGQNTALFGIIHVVSMFIFSMSEAAPFNKGNFSAVLLVLLVCFYSLHVENIIQKETGTPK